MNRKNLDQALAALADALQGQQPPELNVADIAASIPERSLNGNMIQGGKITKFTSQGISDRASEEQVVVTNDSVTVKELAVKQNITAKNIKADILEVREIKTEVKLEKDSSVNFAGDKIYGKGLLWVAKDYNKQFVFNSGPDRFFSSETIDVNKGKSFSIGGVKVIDDQELGPTVSKSNLREVGTLRGLLVDGDVKINQYLCYNSAIDRLGLGIETPNAALSVAEMGVEVMLGTDDNLKGMVGTFGAIDFNIVTDNTTRISVTAVGNITLGTEGRIVSIPGKLGVGVKNPDQNVDLHVAGPVRLNNHIQMYASEQPTTGAFTVGDICWNDKPSIGKFVGWVCIEAGQPGLWYPFGKIEDRK